MNVRKRFSLTALLIAVGLFVVVLAIVIPSPKERAIRKQREQDWNRLAQHLSDLSLVELAHASGKIVQPEGRIRGDIDSENGYATLFGNWHESDASSNIGNTKDVDDDGRILGSAGFLDVFFPSRFSYTIKKEGSLPLEKIDLPLRDTFFSEFSTWCEREHGKTELYPYCIVSIRTKDGSEFEGHFVLVRDRVNRRYALFACFR